MLALTITKLSKYIIEISKTYSDKYSVSLTYNIKTGEIIVLSVNNINLWNKYQVQATPIKILDKLSIYRDKMLKELNDFRVICGYC